MRHGLLLVLLLLAGCSLKSQDNPAPTTAALPPTLAPPVESDWTSVAPGIETRTLPAEPPLAPAPFDVVVVRIDPAQAEFRVHYEPRQWYFIHEWKDTLADAHVIVNANFFSEAGEAAGLVAADGLTYGTSFDGFGGMLQVSGGTVRVRSLVTEPYHSETVEQAAQGFPMLIQPGGEAARTGDGFDDPARRTIIAQDRDGRILILVTPLGLLTFRNAQTWLLAQEELAIDVAFGLDGGKSTGLYVAAPGGGTLYDNFDRVPVVIAVYPQK
jgi:hypothetical protein